MSDGEDRLPPLFRFFNEIGIIAQLSGTALSRALPDGMTLPQFGVLNHFVRLGGEQSPVALARAFQVTKGAMTNTLQHLERKRFIAVRPDPRDGRAKLVTITEDGRRAHARALAALAPQLAAVAERFAPERLAAAVPLLEEVRQWLDERRNAD